MVVRSIVLGRARASPIAFGNVGDSETGCRVDDEEDASEVVFAKAGAGYGAGDVMKGGGSPERNTIHVCGNMHGTHTHSCAQA